MKAAVIYWSGTGNTEQMANAIAEGAGAELFSVSDFTGDIADYDRIAFGCSAMGDEVLEESEFEPFFTAIEGALSGKTIALFGSYGWGDGEWMRNWEERAKYTFESYDRCRAFLCNQLNQGYDLYQALKIS